MRRGFVCVAVLMGACRGNVLEERKLPADVVGDANAVVASNNAFACDLYAQLRGSQGNFFVSPFSISTALAMLEAGARDNTDAQLMAVMRASRAPDSTARAYHALLDSLDIGTSYDGYSLETANRLFVQQDYTLVPAFTSLMTDEYGAPPAAVDFLNASAAANRVNQWVSNETDGAIPALVSSDDFDAYTRLVVANAIHFKGTWSTGFDSTRSGTFHTPTADVTTPMMNKERDPDVSLGSTSDVVLGELPFKGKDLSMVVMMPVGTDDLSVLESAMTAENLQRWLAAPRGTPTLGVNITLPRFGVDTTVDLEQTLSALGAVDMFDPHVANFSGIHAGGELYVDRMRHHAIVNVDENGATATAATQATGDGPHVVFQPGVLNVDHPFVFAIIDKVTGAVLFIGRVVDPTQS